MQYNLTPEATSRFGLSLINALSKEIDSKVFMMGFSASGGFTKRFAIIHPNRIKAAAIGGVGWTTVPLPNWKETELKFSWLESGISELETFTGEPFDLQTFLEVPQLIYVGEQDIIEDRTLPFRGV